MDAKTEFHVHALVASELRKLRGSGDEEGVLFVIARARRLVDRFTDSRPQSAALVALERALLLFYATMNDFLRGELLFGQLPEIVAALRTNNETKIALRVSFRNVSLEDIMIETGQAVDSEKLLARIAPLKELPPDVQEDAIRGIRGAFNRLVFQKLAAALEGMLEVAAEHLAGTNPGSAAQVFFDESIRYRIAYNERLWFGKGDE